MSRREHASTRWALSCISRDKGPAILIRKRFGQLDPTMLLAGGPANTLLPEVLPTCTPTYSSRAPDSITAVQYAESCLAIGPHGVSSAYIQCKLRSYTIEVGG